jgi:hypothetical protein
MHKKDVLKAKAATSKTKKREILKEKVKNEEQGLINSLHRWGEDYYGADDYYEKPVNSMPKTNYYNDYQKKADKQ